jgi:5-methylcytosine-specific restriction endonuclease McrA
MSTPLVLSLDVAGLPRRWIDTEEAVLYYARNLVTWSLGNPVCVYRGGISRLTGKRSEIAPKPIIAVRGKVHTAHFDSAPWLNRDTLFRRDRHICAFCGGQYHAHDLTKDHVTPTSRGGSDRWTNVVTACRTCNELKSNRTPEEAGMKLLYVPYAPNRYEGMILANRHILADQMDYLLAHVPKNSRLWSGRA